jgi:hypothetical protein
MTGDERAAYKKPRGALSSNTGRPANLLRSAAYLGRIVGSPPGLPGGGITGVLAPAFGVGARISGSTPAGGHITPSDFANLSPSGSPEERPTVEPLDPSGTAVPPDCIGAQLADCVGAGVAVRCGGAACVGGCCAWAVPKDAAKAANRTADVMAEGFFHMQTNGCAARMFRPKFRICGSG